MTREEFKLCFPQWEHLTFEYGYFTATHENYDVSWEGEEDGYVSNGLQCWGRTLEDLAEECEAKEEELKNAPMPSFAERLAIHRKALAEQEG